MCWDTLRSSLPPFIQNVAHSLCQLCQRIETLSVHSVLHPSKCRCLAQSYSVLLWDTLTLTSHLSPSSSSSSFLQHKLRAVLTVLLHTLQKGELFIHDCTYQGTHWLIPGSARKQRQWLINKALPIALSTEVFDVHLHDLVWCICTLIWALTDCGDTGLDVRTQAKRVYAMLKETWSLADEEDDIKSMQELFNKMGAKGHQPICNLICRRLSESRSFTLGSDVDVPTYLWMDPQDFENKNDHVLGSSELIVVFETRLMGGRFACKHFYRPGHEEGFKNEAVIQARLRHANVVQLVCCSRGGKTSSLVMELMQQGLDSLISMRRSPEMDTPFSLLAGVDLMLQIAKGMEYLHDLGIMHRDLKSFNILVNHSQNASFFDPRSHVTAKIADFGTSKFKPDTFMYSTKRVGTTIWRAPEVVDDEDEAKYTRQADVYSFAIVCAEILTGLPPDELLPCNRRTELAKVLKEGRRPKLPSSCPPAISSYIEKCWHGDASKRPTFNQICTVFRFFKACLLLRENEMLASPLQDDIFDFGELQRTAAERQSEGMFYHPVLVIPYEMHAFRSMRERIMLEHQESRQFLPFGQGVPMEILVSKILGLCTKGIGEGSLGCAYKCEAEDGSIVVVKQLRKGTIERKDFEQQLSNMVKLKHENLVPLLAYWYTEDKDLLVSEYITNGRCLSDLLHEDDIILDWDTRVRVALGAARGIDYLHDHGYTHGNIKSSNILLTDNDSNCVLSDYGIAQLVGTRDENLCNEDPEGAVTKKMDVYDYGMLLLELLTGENPAISEKGQNLSLFAESREEQIEIFKSLLLRYPDREEEMAQMLQIALECIGLLLYRPEMKEVVKMVRTLISI